MLRAESKRAVKRFGDELQNILDTCVQDTEELKGVFSKGPLGNGETAVRFSSNMQTEVEQLRGKVPPLVRLSTDTPRAGSMLDAAFAHVKAITDVFDRFEERMESAYDIQPVVVPERQLHDPEPSEFEAQEPVVTDVGSLSSLAPSSISKPPKTPAGTTPRSSRKRDVDMPIPATPKLEDFGISHDDVCEDLRGLGMSTVKTSAIKTISTAQRNGQVGTESRMSHYDGTPRNEQGFGGVPNARHAILADNRVEVDLDGDFEENVQKSMTALGIETPVQVAEKFETRRHQALTQMMVTTTPRLKSGGVERTLDYTGLASGYNPSNAQIEMTPSVVDYKTDRQLNFDETPLVRSKGRQGGGGGGGGIRERIGEEFDRLGFWKGKVSCETLQDAAVLLENEGKGMFGKSEVFGVLNGSLPGPVCYSVIASLTKLGVLQMDKRPGEEARYRFVSN